MEFLEQLYVGAELQHMIINWAVMGASWHTSLNFTSTRLGFNLIETASTYSIKCIFLFVCLFASCACRSSVFAVIVVFIASYTVTWKYFKTGLFILSEVFYVLLENCTSGILSFIQLSDLIHFITWRLLLFSAFIIN